MRRKKRISAAPAFPYYVANYWLFILSYLLVYFGFSILTSVFFRGVIPWIYSINPALLTLVNSQVIHFLLAASLAVLLEKLIPAHTKSFLAPSFYIFLLIIGIPALIGPLEFPETWLVAVRAVYLFLGTIFIAFGLYFPHHTTTLTIKHTLLKPFGLLLLSIYILGVLVVASLSIVGGQPETVNIRTQSLKEEIGGRAENSLRVKSVKYVVGEGETLWTIAEDLYKDGTFSAKIAEENGLSGKRLRAGTELTIPVGLFPSEKEVRVRRYLLGNQDEVEDLIKIEDTGKIILLIKGDSFYSRKVGRNLSSFGVVVYEMNKFGELLSLGTLNFDNKTFLERNATKEGEQSVAGIGVSSSNPNLISVSPSGVYGAFLLNIDNPKNITYLIDGKKDILTSQISDFRDGMANLRSALSGDFFVSPLEITVKNKNQKTTFETRFSEAGKIVKNFWIEEREGKEVFAVYVYLDTTKNSHYIEIINLSELTR